MKNEVRPIDANALSRKIREYMDDYPNAAARLTACRAVLSMLGDDKQTPTLTDHFREVRKMAPLTIEELRKMDGQPVYCIDKMMNERSGWGIVREDVCDGYYCVFFFESYGCTWEAYAYPPAHIDRDAWEQCWTCRSVKSEPSWGTKYKYCPKCGRPLTQEAWGELEKRIGGMKP